MKRFSLNFFLMLLVCLLYNDICSAQGQWQQVGENGLAASNAMDQSLAFDSEGNPYIAYQDKVNGFRATIKKFENGNWTTVGESGISVGFAEGLSLAIDNNGIPYIAFIDNGNEAKPVIKKFNGQSWVDVGTLNFLINHTSGISLAINSKNKPYIAFQSKGNEGRATVKRYTGSSWVTVGSPGFSKSYANNISLVFDNNDTPFISYIDEGFGGKAVIKKFDGKSWTNLKSTGLAENYVTGLTLAIDGSSNPYILYRDELANYKATVKKYNGESWDDVGSAGFSNGTVQHTKLVVANNGTPYVAYVDFGNGAIDNVGTTNVRKFNGSDWEDVSPANLKTINNIKNNFSLALALDNDGVPHLAYSNKGSGSKATVLQLSNSAVQNKRPIVKAGEDKTITLPTKSIQLLGSGTDEDGSIKTYNWKQVSGPNQAKFSGLNIMSPIVSGLVAGKYVFSLTAKDNKNATSLADQVSITVLEGEVAVKKVVSFILIDADTKKDLQNLTEGATINLATISAKNLSIRAITNLEVGSVVFKLNGEQEKNIIENIAPYDLLGDNDSWKPVLGDYTIKATPFEQAEGQGVEGNELEVNFSVINENSNDDDETDFPGAQKIVSFTLVNADNNRDIQTIANGATIDLANLPTKNLNIRVNTKGKVASVVLKLSGEQTRTQIENFTQYSLFGGDNGNYNSWQPSVGNYSLEATPYTSYSGKGTAGSSLSINFKIVDQDANTSSKSAARKKLEEQKLINGQIVNVYPNPTASNLYVEVKEVGEGIATINLLDTSGRKVLTKQLETTTNLVTVLKVDQLQPGVYILVISTPKERISRRVVIK